MAQKTSELTNLSSPLTIRMAGVRVDAVRERTAAELVQPLLARPGCDHVVTANLEYLRQASRDARLKEIINDASLVVPDGMPVAWAARLFGAPASRRLTGHDLVEALAELSAAQGVSLFLLGGAPGVAQAAARELRDRYPDVRIAGTYSPPIHPYPFPEREDREMVDRVNASGAAAVLVALGCPKQDLWISDHRHQLRPSLAVGVGCVLDVIAGVRSRAPRWLQALGLEWLWRLGQEPGRLWRRYLLDAAFLLTLISRRARGRLETGAQ